MRQKPGCEKIVAHIAQQNKGEFTDNALSTKAEHCLSSHSPSTHPATGWVTREQHGGNLNSVITTRILHKLNQRLPSCLYARENPKHHKQNCCKRKISATYFPSIDGGNPSAAFQPSPHLIIQRTCAKRTFAQGVHRHFRLNGSQAKADSEV